MNGLADVCLMGLGVGGNYVWCLAIVVIFMRTGGVKRWGAGGSVLKPIFEVANHDGGGQLLCGNFSLCNTAILKLYCKSYWLP